MSDRDVTDVPDSPETLGCTRIDTPSLQSALAKEIRKQAPLTILNCDGGAVPDPLTDISVFPKFLRMTSSDNLNPYADFGQSQEAYTQRMEAIQAMQRLPGMMRRMGNEARMYHS